MQLGGKCRWVPLTLPNSLFNTNTTDQTNQCSLKMKLTSTLTRINDVVINFSVFVGVCQQSKTASA